MPGPARFRPSRGGRFRRSGRAQPGEAGSGRALGPRPSARGRARQPHVRTAGPSLSGCTEYHRLRHRATTRHRESEGHSGIRLAAAHLGGLALVGLRSPARSIPQRNRPPTTRQQGRAPSLRQRLPVGVEAGIGEVDRRACAAPLAVGIETDRAARAEAGVLDRPKFPLRATRGDFEDDPVSVR